MDNIKDLTSRSTAILKLTFILLLVYPVFVSARVPYQYQISNYLNLVSAYDYEDTYSTVEFIPLQDYTNTMLVTISISILAINDFDEVAGSIEIVGALNMRWTDETPRIHSISFSILDPSEDFFLVPPDTIWTPNLVLTNAVGQSGKVGSSQFMAVFNMTTSEVSWTPRVILTSSCTPDMTFYPFDQQSCEFIFTPWGFYHDEILLQTLTDEWDKSEYSESGEWDLVETTIESYIRSDHSYIVCKMKLIRKPLYASFNILLPVLILCGLNSVVFLLPAESGERIGFSITLFLSFMVFLNTVMDFMPRSSSPVSYLCFYLVVMMCNSAGMTLVTVLMMRIYHKPEKSAVPKWLSRLVTFINCGCAKLRCCVLMCRCLRENICKCNKQHDDNKSRDRKCCSRVCKRRRSKSNKKISTSVKTLSKVNTITDVKHGAIPWACCLKPKTKQTDVTCERKYETAGDEDVPNSDGGIMQKSITNEVKRTDKSKQYTFDIATNSLNKSRNSDQSKTDNNSSTKFEIKESNTRTTQTVNCFTGIKLALKKRENFIPVKENEPQVESTVENTKLKFRPAILDQQVRENNDGKAITLNVTTESQTKPISEVHKEINVDARQGTITGHSKDINTLSGLSIPNESPEQKDIKQVTHLNKNNERNEEHALPKFKEPFLQINSAHEKLSVGDLDSLDFFKQFQDSASEESDGETMSVYSQKSMLRMKSKQAERKETNSNNKLKESDLEKDKPTTNITNVDGSTTETIKNKRMHGDSREDFLKEYQDSLSEDSDGETISIFSNVSRIESANTKRTNDNTIDRSDKSINKSNQNIQHTIPNENKPQRKEKPAETRHVIDSKISSAKVQPLYIDTKLDKRVSNDIENTKLYNQKTGDSKRDSTTGTTIATNKNNVTKDSMGSASHNSIKKPALTKRVTHSEDSKIVNAIKKRITFAKEETEKENKTISNKLSELDEVKTKLKIFDTNVSAARRMSTPYIRHTDRPRRHSVAHTIRPDLKEFIESKEEDDGLNPDVEWADVGRVLDFFFFLAFLALQIFLTTVFFIPIATSSSSEE